MAVSVCYVNSQKSNAKNCNGNILSCYQLPCVERSWVFHFAIESSRRIAWAITAFKTILAYVRVILFLQKKIVAQTHLCYSDQTAYVPWCFTYENSCAIFLLALLFLYNSPTLLWSTIWEGEKSQVGSAKKYAWNNLKSANCIFI